MKTNLFLIPISFFFLASLFSYEVHISDDNLTTQYFTFEIPIDTKYSEGLFNKSDFYNSFTTFTFIFNDLKTDFPGCTSDDILLMLNTLPEYNDHHQILINKLKIPISNIYQDSIETYSYNDKELGITYFSILNNITIDGIKEYRYSLFLILNNRIAVIELSYFDEENRIDITENGLRNNEDQNDHKSVTEKDHYLFKNVISEDTILTELTKKWKRILESLIIF